MAAAGNFVLPVFRQGSNDHQDGGPSRALPTWIAPHEAAPTHSQYPLSMLAPKAHAYLNSQYPNLKRQHAHQGPQFILIHPTDAKVRSIDDKATVQVVNGRGSFLAQAKVTDEVMAGVVVAPFGDWMSQVDGGATPAALTPTAYADLGRAPTFSDNRVEVSLPR